MIGWPWKKRALVSSYFQNLTSVSAPAVNPGTVESLTAALACVSLVSETIASLPVSIYRQPRGGDKTLATNHQVYAWLDDGPNVRQSWHEFCAELVADILLRGNSLAHVDWTARTITPLSWTGAELFLAPDGSIVYTATPKHLATAPRLRLEASDVLHLRDRSDDAVTGRSRIQRSVGGVQGALAVQNHANAMWRQGAAPTGLVTSKRQLSPEGKKMLGDDFSRLYSGAAGAGKTIVIDGEVDYKPLSVNAGDTELLASRRFSTEEVCRIFGVPPSLVGDMTNSSFTNAETMLRAFAQLTIAPLCNRIAATLTRSLLDGDFHLEFDLEGLQRGDPAGRWAANAQAVNSGLLTPNEIRQAEGYNPLPGGDVLRAPSGSSPATSV